MVDQDNKEKESGTRVGTKVDSRQTNQSLGTESSSPDTTRVGTKVDSRETESTGKEDKSSSEPPDTMRGA